MNIDVEYMIIAIYGVIMFAAGFMIAKNLCKEHISDLIEMIHELKSEIKSLK